ncbi:MAG: protein kinase [Myxococcales bacterium]|nr:protein kinase [Myxococcales bacterium]
MLLKIASGGMGSVHVGRLRGALGFTHLVAVKRPHPHLAEDPRFREMLVNEARVASAIHHANVVAIRDVERVGDDVVLVMDYVEGGGLSELVLEGEGLPPAIAIRVVLDACAGLHAAHEATNDAGVPLHVVHRDVSPHNVLVGIDGVARVTDFGIAKCLAESRDASTTGSVKGKLAYMAPEYVGGGEVDRRADVFALGVVLWEALAGARLFRGKSDAETLDRILRHHPAPPPRVDDRVAAVVARALAKEPAARYPTAEALGEALEVAARAAGALASHREVSALVRERLGAALAERRALLRARDEAPSAPSVEAAPAPGEATAPVGVTESLPRPIGDPDGDFAGRTLPMAEAPRVAVTTAPMPVVRAPSPPVPPEPTRSHTPDPVEPAARAAGGGSRLGVALVAGTLAAAAALGVVSLIKRASPLAAGGAEVASSRAAAGPAPSAPVAAAPLPSSAESVVATASAPPSASATSSPPARSPAPRGDHVGAAARPAAASASAASVGQDASAPSGRRNPY